MWIIVGLGNPGDKYENNRHNIGFMAVDEIVHRHNFSGFEKKFNGFISTGSIGTEKVLVLKPQTYMNLSGDSVLAATGFYKVPPENIIVIHDDMDLEAGKIRIKQGGGAGGHNGLRSIDSHLGQNYLRVRLGVGHPGEKGKVVDFVLGDFSKADKEWRDLLLKEIADNIELMIKGDKDTFASKISQVMHNLKGKDKDGI